jgi:transcriptional regulator with PAS, ATPase and Fis domain
MPLNMDALTGTLFDAEFFGHTKGAFTGAERDRAGYLESADKGTLFLDEIGNMALDLQGKLLRVLQDGEFFKIGTSKLLKANVRIIAATNTDLDLLMTRNQFRKDLYYRLSGGWLNLPPLKERKDDVPLLVSRFIEEFCGPGGANVKEEVLTLLTGYEFPGNIRELKSIVQSAVNLAQGNAITVEHLPRHLVKKATGPNTKKQTSAEPIPTLAELEKAHIRKVYRQLNNNKAESARVLGIGINTLRRKLESYGIE